MARHVHVHIHRAAAADEEEEGRWVTVHGARIHIGKDGYVDKGPKEIVDDYSMGGHTEHSLHAKHHMKKSGEHQEAMEKKGEDHPDYTHHRNAANEHYSAFNEFGHAHAVHKLNATGKYNANIEQSARRGHEFAASAEKHASLVKQPKK